MCLSEHEAGSCSQDQRCRSNLQRSFPYSALANVPALPEESRITWVPLMQPDLGFTVRCEGAIHLINAPQRSTNHPRSSLETSLTRGLELQMNSLMDLLFYPVAEKGDWLVQCLHRAG
jgi:hypothetical protein